MLNFNFQQKASKTPTNQIYHTKKRAASQIKYQKSPDIITQVKPLYLNRLGTEEVERMAYILYSNNMFSGIKNINSLDQIDITNK